MRNNNFVRPLIYCLLTFLNSNANYCDTVVLYLIHHALWKTYAKFTIDEVEEHLKNNFDSL